MRPTTWWRTSKPSIVCTFSRSSSASVGATPSGSWFGERMRPSMNAVVAGLPKSWQTAPEHDRESARAVEIVDARPRLVDHHQRVHPDVALGMPLGLLRAADQRRHFREERARRRRVRGRARIRSTAGAAQHQQLLNLPQNPLARQVVEGDARGRRVSSPASIVELETGRELERAQHAQAVVGKRRGVDHPENAPLEVAPPSERVESIRRTAGRGESR